MKHQSFLRTNLTNINELNKYIYHGENLLYADFSTF
jgi:hypothetical protein